MTGCEILSAAKRSVTAEAILGAMELSSPMPTVLTTTYAGQYDWLMMWGVGRKEHSEACNLHVKSGRHVILWDLGYFGRAKGDGYARLSIDGWHPEQWLDKTIPDPSRWNALGISITEQSNPDGHIVLVGMGPKSHAYTGERDWEIKKFAELKKRFPNRKIVFRPKPGKPYPLLKGCAIDRTSPIQDVLNGVSLVVCRHSNVACDAVVMGIPFECDEGAAKWLQYKPYTREARLDFLYRLAWWQWLSTEAAQAWKFILQVTA